MATLDPAVVALCSNLDADAVKEIIDTELSDGEINVAINVAYYMTRSLSGNLDACGGGSMECEIIRFLAAHVITVRERQAKGESVAGEWSITYLGRDGMGLESSLYGQQVLTMDCSGNLAKLGLKGMVFQVADYAQLADLTTDD